MRREYTAQCPVLSRVGTMMNRWLFPVCVVMPAVIPVRAQLFGPESLTGAALGGIAGAVIGHNSGRHGGEGAAIGAGVGLVLGAIAGQERRRMESDSYYEGYGPYYSRPNYAVSGMVVGGVAGAVIGHNNGRHAAEGAAIGAASGLVLGAVAESAVRQPIPPARTVLVGTMPAYISTSPAVQPAEPALAPTQNVFVHGSFGAGGSPSTMASANSLFGR